MKQGQDIAVQFGDLYLVHQNIPGKRHVAQSHACSILFIPLQGEINIEIQSQQFKLGPGHMLFLPANVLHSFNSSSFTGERLIAMMNPRHPAAKSLQDFQPTILAMSQLIKEILFYLLLHPKTRNSKSLISVLIETLGEALQAPGVSASSTSVHVLGKIKDPRIQKVIFFVQENYSDKISMDALAKQAGLSTRNLNRLMLQEIGLTPKQFLTSTSPSVAGFLTRVSF